jgi:hypothetical protein
MPDRVPLFSRLALLGLGLIGSSIARATSGHAAAAPPSADMNCRLPMPAAIWPSPNGIMLAAMWERISRSNRQVCDRLYGGPSAKMLAVFLQRKMSLLAHRVT